MNYLANLKSFFTRPLVIVVAAAIVVVFLLGLYFGGVFRRDVTLIDGMTPEAKQKYEEKEAESNRLRGENNQLRSENDGIRQHNTELEAKNAVIEKIIDERGGAIEQKYNAIEGVKEKLKTDEAAIRANNDLCATCRLYSTEALRKGLIARALTCDRQCGTGSR